MTNKKNSNTERETLNHQLKLILMPILRSLGIPDDRIAKYKYVESQLVGLCVSEITVLKGRLRIAEKELKQYKLIEVAAQQLKMFP